MYVEPPYRKLHDKARAVFLQLVEHLPTPKRWRLRDRSAWWEDSGGNKHTLFVFVQVRDADVLRFSMDFLLTDIYGVSVSPACGAPKLELSFLADESERMLPALKRALDGECLEEWGGYHWTEAAKEAHSVWAAKRKARRDG